MKSQFKKLTAWLLMLAMLFTMLPSFAFTAFAEDSADVASVTDASGSLVGTYTIEYEGYDDKKISVFTKYDKDTATEGETVTLKAEAIDNYRIAIQVMQGETEVEVTDNGNGIYTFTMPAGNVTVKVSAEMIPTKYTISISSSDNGQVLCELEEAEADTEVTLTVVPAEDYTFGTLQVTKDGTAVGFTGNGYGTYTFIMPEGSVVVTATFVENFDRYPLWVGGEQFSGKNLTIYDGNGGTATYDPVENTLTLDNYTYSGVGYLWNGNSHASAIYYYGNDPLNLVMNGTNSITHVTYTILTLPTYWIV